MINLYDYISQCYTRKRQLEGEISRLETAKTAVREIKSNLKEDQSDVSEKNSGRKLELSWKGSNYNTYLDQLGSDVKSSFRFYVDNVDDVLDEICDAITKRENEINNQVFLIGHVQSLINSGLNEVEKLFN